MHILGHKKDSNSIVLRYFYLRNLEKEEPFKHIASRRKEIVQSGAESNKIKVRKTVQEISETKV